MSRYRKVESHLKQLQELQAIITSMKTLSQLELRKLAGVTERQGAMVEMLERISGDFLKFFPQPELGDDNELWLVIGSERGFCGPFNELLVNQLVCEWPECINEPQRVLAVGHKLCWRLDERLPGYSGLPGASASEEIPTILTQVVSATREQLARHDSATLRVLFHGNEGGTVVSRRLLPPDKIVLPEASCFPPELYLEPDSFFRDFLQHYLIHGLIQLFTVSLLAENRYRVQHLGGAVHRLDERLAILHSQARALRQEEITEEIEMILLGSGAFDSSVR